MFLHIASKDVKIWNLLKNGKMNVLCEKSKWRVTVINDRLSELVKIMREK